VGESGGWGGETVKIGAGNNCHECEVTSMISKGGSIQKRSVKVRKVNGRSTGSANCYNTSSV